MSEQNLLVRPAAFSRHLLEALAAAEGRRRRRKRDTTADAIGLELKRSLLERAIAADPEPDDFEAWLLEQTLSAPASGPVRAVALQIFDEYQLAARDPAFAAWLAAGAPSADAEPPAGELPPEIDRRHRCPFCAVDGH